MVYVMSNPYTTLTGDVSASWRDAALDVDEMEFQIWLSENLFN